MHAALKRPAHALPGWAHTPHRAATARGAGRPASAPGGRATSGPRCGLGYDDINTMSAVCADSRVVNIYVIKTVIRETRVHFDGINTMSFTTLLSAQMAEWHKNVAKNSTSDLGTVNNRTPELQF